MRSALRFTSSLRTRVGRVHSVGVLAGALLASGCSGPMSSPDADGPARASGGGPAARGDSGGEPGAPTLGASCTGDADCGSGLTCLTAASSALGGGPPHGVCTLDCSQDPSGANTCARIAPDSVCTPFTRDSAYCMEACTTGAVSKGETKCHGRKDVACTVEPPRTSSYCRPTCRNDSDCDGRRCDLSSGLCVEALAGKRSLGDACDPRAATAECRGAVCIGGTDADSGAGGGFCSGRCRLGGVGCGQDPSGNAPLAAMCLLIPQGAPLSVGDEGYCAALCDCDGECPLPGSVCEPLSSEYRAASRRAGSCAPATSVDGGVHAGIPCSRTPIESDAGDAGAAPDAS